MAVVLAVPLLMVLKGVLRSGSAIRTRMVCVGELQRFHTNRHVARQPGTGVVTSAGLYRRLVGKMGTVSGVLAREGDRGSMPLPLVVVDSAKTTMMRLGFFAINCWMLTSSELLSDCDAVGAPSSEAGETAWAIAASSDTVWRRREKV